MRARGLNYTTGFVYKYNYAAEIETGLIGVDENTAVIRLNAALDLHATSACRLRLTITHVSIIGLDKTQSELLQLQLRSESIEFEVMENGEIKNTCTKRNPHDKATNVLKGIVSLLQTAHTINTGRKRRHRNDVDIFGNCPTLFTIQPGWKTTLINREKNLEKCIQLGNTNHIIGRRPRSLPLVRGTQKCRQAVTTILNHANCEEKHILNPFSNGQAGAITKINQNLHFLQRKPIPSENNTFSCMEMKSLIMEPINQNLRQTTNPVTESQQLIQELCKDTKRGVSSSTLSAFENLIGVLESCTGDQLVQILNWTDNSCLDNPRIKTILLDALIGVDTAASISVMSSLSVRDALPMSVRNSWFNSLGFRYHVDPQQIAALTPLFTSSMSKQTQLAVSTYLSIYCRFNSSCIRDNNVQQFVQLLQEKLLNQCVPFNHSVGDEVVLIALKSLGNLGLGSVPRLTQCAINSETPVYLRVAAIESFRRISCLESRQKIFELFQHRNNPSELRIVAYLESMRCPTPALIQSIEQILTSETVNQVGSFVWTHLRNIRESSDECKAALQSLLSNINLGMKFSKDGRKFSRFYETSFYSELLDTGVHAESYVIFPTDSYLPRSLMINLTSDVFGKTVHLFEVSIRSEGMESLVETAFGPKGLFPTKSTPGSTYKGRIDEEKLDQISQKELPKSRFGRHPQAFASIKVLGNEMWVWSSGDDELVTRLSQAFDWRHHLTKLAEEQQIQLSRTSKLVDTHLRYPTGTGFALETFFESSAALELSAAGRVDIRNLISSGSAHIEGSVTPSGVLRLATGFYVEGIGLKMHTTFVSTAVIEGRMEMRARQLFRTHINVPIDKMFTAELQHQVIIVDATGDHQIEGIIQDRQEAHYCSGSLTSTPLGFQFCGHLSYPNASQVHSAPYFPLTGPAALQLLIEKTDPSLDTFVIEYRYEEEKLIHSNDHLHIFLLSFNTPRSNIDRQLTAEFLHNRHDKHVTLRLITPWKKATLTGNYLNEPNHKKLDATVTIDRQKYLVQSEWRRETFADMIRIIPNLYIRTPSAPLCALSGSIVLQADKKLTIDLQLEHLSTQLITLKGDIIKSERHPVRLDWNLRFVSPILKTFLTGSYQVDADVLVLTCSAHYSWRDSEQQLIELLSKVRKTALPNHRLNRLTFMSHLQLSAFPQYNTLLAWTFMSAEGHMENTVRLGLGEQAEQLPHQMKLEQIFSYVGTIKRNNFTALFRFSYPVKNLEMGLSIDHSNQPRKLATRIALHTSSLQKMCIMLNLTDHTKTLAELEVQLKFEMPNRTVIITSHLEEQDLRHYLLNCTASWNPGKQITAIADYINKSHRKQLYHTISTNLTTINQHVWQWNCNLIAKENHIHLGNTIESPINNIYSTILNLTKPHFAKYWLFTQLTWPLTEYTAEANLTLGDEKILQTQVSLAPNTQIISYAATKIYDDVLSLDLDFFWDAKRNRSQCITFGGEYRKLSPDKSKGRIDFTLPGQNISGHILKTQQGYWGFGPLFYRTAMVLEWSPTEKMSLDVNADRVIQGYRQENRFETQLQTPFNNFERTTIKMTSVDDAMEWQRQILIVNNERFQLGANAKLTEILDSQRSEASVFWRSNITKDWQKADLGGWYVSGHNHMTSQMNLEWDNDKKISFQVDVNNQSTMQLERFSGGFNLTSPWFTGTTLATRLHHARHGAFIDSWFHTQWASSKRFKVHVKTNDDQYGKRFNLTIDTPVTGYKQIGLEANHLMEETRLSTNAAFKWRKDRKVQIHISACAVSLDRHSSNLSAKFEITTPFASFDVLATEFSWIHDKHSTGVRMAFQWPTSKTFRIDAKTLKGNRVGIERQIQIQTPWSGYERFGALLSYKITNNRINCSAIVNRDKPLIDCRFTHNVNKNGAQTTFTLVTTSETVWLKVIRQNKKFGGEMVNRKVEIQLPKRQIQASADIDIDDLLTWKANIDVNANGSRLVTIDMHQLIRSSNWNHETRIVWKETPFLHLFIHGEKDGPTKGHLCLSTDFDVASNSSCNDDPNKIVQVRIDSEETATSVKFNIDVSHPKWPFHVTITKSDMGANSVRLRGVISWENQTQTSVAEFDAVWSGRPTGRSLGLTFIHPIYRTVVVNGSYEKNSTSFEHKIQLVLDEDRKIGYEILTEIVSVGDEKKHRASFALIHAMRIVKMQGILTKDKKSTRGKLEINWDAERHSEQVVVIRAESLNPHDGHFEALIGFRHPKLQNEFIAAGSLSYANASELFNARFFANYSSDPRELASVSVRVANASKDNDTNFAAIANIVHESTGINCEVRTRGKQTSTNTMIEGVFNYLDRYEISHEKIISVEIDTNKKELEIKMVNDGRNQSFAAQITNTETQCDVHLNQDEQFNIVHILVDKEHWRSSFALAKNDHSRYKVLSGFDDNVRRIGFTAVANDTNDPDINVQLLLETPYLVVSEILWKLDISTTIKNSQKYIKDRTIRFVDDIQTNWNEIQNELDEEISEKMEIVSDKIYDFMQPITKHLRESLNRFQTEMRQITSQFTSSYDKNIFFIKDAIVWINIRFGQQFVHITESVTKSWHDFIRELERIHSTITEMLWEWKETTSDVIDEMCTDIVKWIVSRLEASEIFLTNFRTEWKTQLTHIFHLAKTTLIACYNRLKNATSVISEILSSIWNSFTKIGSKISQVWTDFKSFVSDHWYEFRTRFTQSELYVTLRAWVVDTYYTILDTFKYEIYEPFMERVRSVIRILSEHPLIVMIRKAACKLWSTVRSWVESVLNNPHVRTFRTTIVTIYQKIKWFVDYHHLSSNWKRLPLRLYDLYKSVTQRRGYQLNVRMDTRNKVLFLPSEGQIRTEQHLPMPWYSLTQIPKFQQLPEIRTIQWFWSTISSRRTTIWEKYYQYRPYFSPSTWLPPFPTFAAFASDYFFITLDGVHYAYTGECVYVLAHDFAGGNLSLSVDFSSRPFSLILLIGGKEVEIGSKVSVNGRKSELPLIIGDANIVRHGNILYVYPARGTSLQCHLEYEVCWLWMDGWYFGRTAGLLGRYNNEPSDDVVLGNASFPSQWEVGRGGCKSHVNRAPIVSDFQSDIDCWSYFENQYSFFKLCFSRVDPAPFLSSCRGDSFQGLGLCRTALSYVSACDFQGIPLAMPYECVHCTSLDDTEMRAGDNITVRSGQVAPSADVVLIFGPGVGKQQCDIQSLFHRFFGGHGVNDRPHIRTLDGELFGDARQFASSWSSFTTPTSGTGVEDAFAALQFSSNLPFRIGVSKIFVPLLCVPCARSTNSLVGMDYPEVHRMLIEDGISIHLLLDHDFDIKRTKDFFGLDAKRAYTSKDARAKRVTGDADLRHQVQPPKFICVPLALESNGTLFSSKRLGDGRANKKNFLNVFARRVADAVSHGHECQQCDCIASSQHGSGRVHCQPCHFPKPISDSRHVSNLTDVTHWTHPGGPFPDLLRFCQIHLKRSTRDFFSLPGILILLLQDEPDELELVTNKTGILHLSDFDGEKKTKVIVHGFLHSVNEKWVSVMKRELLLKEDCNVIFVEWGDGAGLPYMQACANARVTGDQVAHMLRFLKQEANLDLKRVHIIGQGLGAHVAGYAGKTSKVGRITALDPVDPYFSGSDTKVRLDKSDADFVDVIHTDGSSLLTLGMGMNKPIGHVDFYPNNGRDQPGCGDLLDRVTGSFWDLMRLNLIGAREGLACSHRRAIDLFTESINTKCSYVAFPCKDVDEFKSGKCRFCHHGKCSRIGYPSDEFKGRGSMYLSTNGGSPFCRFTFLTNVTISTNQKATTGEIYAQVLGRSGRSDFSRINNESLNVRSRATYTTTLLSVVEISEIIGIRVKFVD
uniref:Vitellogenin domain-containing protein n=1 Tax=Strigamia maritima TaxID=126957 RepID=T1J6R0_STRMM